VLGFDRDKANRFAWNLNGSQATVVGQFEGYGLQLEGYGLQLEGYGLQLEGYGLQLEGYGLQLEGYGLQPVRKLAKMGVGFSP
jgi:hypothetical protein